MRPNPTAWWLRPVSSDARVGEHNDVVWKLVKRRPFSAKPSNVGVSRSEPKQPSCENPTSSSTTTNTFGASCGAVRSGGHHGVDSKWYRPMTPLNSPSYSIGGAYG